MCVSNVLTFLLCVWHFSTVLLLHFSPLCVWNACVCLLLSCGFDLLIFLWLQSFNFLVAVNRPQFERVERWKSCNLWSFSPHVMHLFFHMRCTLHCPERHKDSSNGEMEEAICGKIFFLHVMQVMHMMHIPYDCRRVLYIRQYRFLKLHRSIDRFDTNWVRQDNFWMRPVLCSIKAPHWSV